MLECKNEKAIEESRELLVDLHLRLSHKYQKEDKSQILSSFIEKCMKVLLQYKDQMEKGDIAFKLLNVVKILSEFLDRYEGKKPRKPDIKVSAFQYNIKPFSVTFIKSKGWS